MSKADLLRLLEFILAVLLFGWLLQLIFGGQHMGFM